MKADHPELGVLNRVTGEKYYIGGKGINNSILSRNLGIESIDTCFLGGLTGHYISDELKAYRITNKFIEVQQKTRINLKLKHGQETEFNGKGPELSSQDLDRLSAFLKENMGPEDTLFLTGNKGNGMDTLAFSQAAKLTHDKGTRLILDTNGDLLTACLQYEPFLIKPNIKELEEVFKQTISGIDEVVHYARQLKVKGAQHILISMGKDGAVLVTEDDHVYQAKAPSGQVISTVGSGDSMLAAFVAKFDGTHDFAESLRFAIAAGTATALSHGIAKKELIDDLFKQVDVEKVSQ